MEKWPIGVFTSIDAGWVSSWKSRMNWASPRFSCMPPRSRRVRKTTPTAFWRDWQKPASR